MASLAACLDACTHACSITSIVAVEGTSTVSNTETCTGLTSLPFEGLSIEVSLVLLQAGSKEPTAGRIP
jgi:hypothetical protein